MTIHYTLVYILANLIFVSSVFCDNYRLRNNFIRLHQEKYNPLENIKHLDEDQSQCECSQRNQNNEKLYPPSINNRRSIFGSALFLPSRVVRPSSRILRTAPSFQSHQNILPYNQPIHDQNSYRSLQSSQSYTHPKYHSGIPKQILQPLSQITQPQFNSPPNFDINQPQNNILTKYGRRKRSKSLRSSNSRSAMESSKAQKCDDVASQSPIIIKKSSLNTSYNNTRKKRQIALNREIDFNAASNKYPHIAQTLTTTIAPVELSKNTNTEQYIIIPESATMTRIPFELLNNTNEYHSFESSDDIYIDYDSANTNYGVDWLNPVSNISSFVSNTRLDGTDRKNIHIPTGSHTYPTYIGAQRVSGNSLATSAIPTFHSQPPLDPIAYQPISNHKNTVDTISHIPYSFPEYIANKYNKSRNNYK